MTEQEINEVVARKLGWREQNADRFPWMNSQGMELPIPEFCTSISAAWEIVDKIKQTELFALCWHDGFWHCEINCCDGEREIDEESETAPMAICLAFLKLKD